MTYWAQFTLEEIRDMHGIDEDLDTEECQFDDDTIISKIYEDLCPKCKGTGCNYCLMCDY